MPSVRRRSIWARSPAFLYGFNQRERIYDIMDFISGQRVPPGLHPRRRGPCRNCPMRQCSKRWSRTFIFDQLPPAINDIRTLLTNNRIFRERTEGIGTITHDEAVAWSLSGPVARAAGVRRRSALRTSTYLCYADNWDGNGVRNRWSSKSRLRRPATVFARYLVRPGRGRAIGLDH